MSQSSLTVFNKYLPPNAVSYCHDLLLHYGFRFKISRARKTKLGDYRFLARERKHMITINHDLNPYQFLVTYLHEVAHLVTFEKYQHRVQPHGKEWKANFKELAQPVLNAEVLPTDLITVLNDYMTNPKASSCADPFLFKALSRYDERSIGEQLLSDVPLGEVFEFNERLFQKESLKRTRSVCLELKTGKKYLIPEVATVISKGD